LEGGTGTFEQKTKSVGQENDGEMAVGSRNGECMIIRGQRAWQSDGGKREWTKKMTSEEKELSRVVIATCDQSFNRDFIIILRFYVSQ
jgi:hypothetical protein